MGNLKLKQYIACNKHQTSQELQALKKNQELLATFPDFRETGKVWLGPGKVYHVPIINAN